MTGKQSKHTTVSVLPFYAMQMDANYVFLYFLFESPGGGENFSRYSVCIYKLQCQQKTLCCSCSLLS